jgi:hypothetical protein
MPRSPAQRAAKRDHINRLRRQLYQGKIPRVNVKQLALFRADPQREARLKLKYVVCRECGAKLQILSRTKGGHLHDLHKMTIEEYLKKWPGAPLVSVAFRKERSLHGKKPKTALKGHSRPNLKIRGRVDGRPLDKSQLAPLLALGFSYSEIGKRLDRFFTTIADAIKRMGLQPATKEDRQMLTECRAFLRENPSAGIKELKNWLSEQTMLSKAQHRNGTRFARFSALDLKPLFEKKRGRKLEEEENKTYYKIGLAVEKEIPVHLKQDRHSIVDARRSVAASTHLEFDVVAEYHRRFRQSVHKPQQETPA